MVAQRVWEAAWQGGGATSRKLGLTANVTERSCSCRSRAVSTPTPLSERQLIGAAHCSGDHPAIVVVLPGTTGLGPVGDEPFGARQLQSPPSLGAGLMACPRPCPKPSAPVMVLILQSLGADQLLRLISDANPKFAVVLPAERLGERRLSRSGDVDPAHVSAMKVVK